MANVRLNKIKGQLNGIEKMLNEGRSCTDVLQQIVAVRAALAKLGTEILKDEANICSINNDQEELKKVIDQVFRIS